MRALDVVSAEKEEVAKSDAMGLVGQQVSEPVIFTDKEYEARRVDYNPGVDRIPHDFLLFGPTELENPLRELLREDDQWAFIQEKEGKMGASACGNS